jgi:hypothetical protein
MTTGPTFQLFPPPQKKPKRPDLSAAVQAALANNPKKVVKSPVDLKEVVIHVTPAPAAIPPPPPRRRDTQGTQDGLFQAVSAPKAVDKTRQVDGPVQVAKPVQHDQLSQAQSQALFQSSHAAPVVVPVAPEDLPRGVSPAPTEYLSVRSGTPTLVRSNTNATARTAFGGPTPAMRSIFPQYNPNLPLSHQHYIPTQVSPPGIPREKISKQPYSPEFVPPPGLYIPHANVRDQQAPKSPSSTPSHTPLEQLELAWEVTNGHGNAAHPASITLPMHRAVSSPNPSKSPRDTRPKGRICFGPSREEPFYSLAQSAVPTFLQEADASASPRDQELSLQRHHPSQMTSVPVAEMTLRPPPFRQQSSHSQSQSRDLDCIPHLVTTIYPKLAAMCAIEAVANSPAAAEIARIDPNACSPAAAQLAQDAVADAASRECCALFWVPPLSPDTPSTLGQSSNHGSYELHHPTLGTFPIAVNGNVSRHFATALEPSPTRPTTSDAPNFSRPNPTSSLKAPVQNASVVVLDPRAQPATEFGRPGRPATLARLELSSVNSPTCNALTLDLPAIVRSGNPFLADAVAAAILAVAAAEVERGSSSSNSSSSAASDSIIDGLSGDLAMLMDNAAMFPAPPRSPMPPQRKMKSSKHSHKSSSSSDRDVSRWKSKFNKKSKQAIEVAELQGRSAVDDLRGDDGRLTLPMRMIVGTLKFTFKTAVFVVEVAFKIVGGVVVGVIKRVDRID